MHLRARLGELSVRQMQRQMLRQVLEFRRLRRSYRDSILELLSVDKGLEDLLEDHLLLEHRAEDFDGAVLNVVVRGDHAAVESVGGRNT